MAKDYDVIIIGAGPAGCTAALALKDAGLQVALLDKSFFPRDKVCGDAIPGRAIKTLKSIAPELATAFKSLPDKYHTTQTSLNYKGRQVWFGWAGEAYTCARMHFDNFLFTQVQQYGIADIYCGFRTGQLIVEPDGVFVTNKDGGQQLNAKLIIGADGAHSETAKQLAQRTVDKKHHVGSVRAYYENISGTEPFKTEVYFDKRFLPSYLWIFPLPDNKANVGFGMLSSEIIKRRANLKTMFYDFIEHTPALNKRFEKARQISVLEGFGLPLGSRQVTVSGTRFMLVGDAASLIDPISGDGIGNAMLSGKLAAEQAIKCFQANDFTHTYMAQYGRAVYETLAPELSMHHQIQQALFRMPFLLDIAFSVGSNKYLNKLLKKAF